MKNKIMVECVEGSSKTQIQDFVKGIYNEYDVVSLNFSTYVDNKGKAKYCVLVTYKERRYGQIDE